MSPKTILQRASTLSSQKQQLRDRLKKNSDRLRPGIWILHDSTIARHVSVRHIPAAITDTKSTSRHGSSWCYLSVRRILLKLIYPALCRLSGKNRDTEGARRLAGRSIAISSKAGKLLIFDGVRKEVIHASDESDWGSAWETNVRNLGEYFRIPTFSVNNCRNLMTEEWVSGRPLGRAESARREIVTRQLFGAMHGLASHHSNRPDPIFWREVTKHGKNIQLPTAIVKYLAANWNRILPMVSSLPFVTSHGDLSGNNLLVSGSSWCLIDFEDCCQMPAFFDLFFLAHQEWLVGRADIWDALFEGVTKRREPTLFADLNTFIEPLSLVDWGLAMLLAECYSWKRKVGAPPLGRRQLALWSRPIVHLLFAK